MKRDTEYARAVALARAAAQDAKDRPATPSLRSAEQILADLMARGVPPSAADLEALKAALERRGRGRPRGPSNPEARRVLWLALGAVEAVALPTYRSSTGAGGWTRCDAVAAALSTTYDACANEMRKLRRLRRTVVRAGTGTVTVSGVAPRVLPSAAMVAVGRGHKNR